jgi:hypothetical protein
VLAPRQTGGSPEAREIDQPHQGPVLHNHPAAAARTRRPIPRVSTGPRSAGPRRRRRPAHSRRASRRATRTHA